MKKFSMKNLKKTKTIIRQEINYGESNLNINPKRLIQHFLKSKK